jgi:hypothetical protein
LILSWVYEFDCRLFLPMEEARFMWLWTIFQESRFSVGFDGLFDCDCVELKLISVGALNVIVD